VLEQLRLLLLQDPAWRKPLYGAWGAGAMRDAAIQRATELMAELPGLASGLDAEFVTAPKLSEKQRISLMNTRSRVQRTPNTSLILGDPPAESGEQDNLLASIEINDRSTKQIMSEIEMPSRCAPVLRWIDKQRSSFQVSELAVKFPELTEDQHLQLIQGLVGTGLLKVYWFPKLKETHVDT
jgi:hypothetical protein